MILPDGKLSVFIAEGTFAEGKVKMEKMLSDLGLDGLEFSEVGQVEQHKHDTEHAHVHASGEVHEG